MSWFMKDWGIKLISLVLAVGLWYYAVGEESVEVKRVIPLELPIKNPQMSVLRSSVRSVWVTLAAPRHLLSDLTAKDIRAVHEIGAEISTAGEYSFRLESQEIKLPSPQIRVVRIVPETIRVTLDELITQKLKIKPAFIGEPAFGYSIREDEIEIDPNAILLEGPKGQLEKFDFVKTEPIDLVGRIRSFRRTVTLDLPHNVKPQSEAVVDIFIPIKEEFGEKQFEQIPVKVLLPTDKQVNFQIDPQIVSFVLKGSIQQLENLKPEKLLAYVDLDSVDKKATQAPVQIVLPEGVSLKEAIFVTVNRQ